MNIEPLESRIAPSVVAAANHLSATYTDVDGDLVTIKASKPILDDGDFLSDDPAGLGELLIRIDLSDDLAADVNGVTLSITATPQDLTPNDADHSKSGDGFASVNRINATDRVLGSVTVDGHLGEIDAGYTATNRFAIQSLTVQSLGNIGLVLGAVQSDIAGSVKSITVKDDVRDTYVAITGEVNAVKSSLGALTVGGSLLGGGVDADGNIGNVKVGGSVIGGSVQGSTVIRSLNGSMGNVTIGGDVIGGPAGFNGYISASTSMGAVSIGGDLRGGGTAGGFGNSGFISTGSGNIASVKIGGSMIGGPTAYGGSVAASTAASGGKLGAVTVGGDVIGGTAANTGRISAASDIGAVFIGGSLIGGSLMGGTPFTDAGLIASGGALRVDSRREKYRLLDHRRINDRRRR